MEKYGPLQPLVSICDREGIHIQFTFYGFIINSLFLPSQPQTPNLEDDINEVILRDAGIDFVSLRSTPPEQRRKTMVAKSALILYTYFNPCTKTFMHNSARPDRARGT